MITVNELKDFSTNRVWLEIESAIREELELIERDMDTAPQHNINKVNDDGTTTFVAGYEALQGGRQKLRGVLAMPKELLENLAIDIQNEGKEDNERE